MPAAVSASGIGDRAEAAPAVRPLRARAFRGRRVALLGTGALLLAALLALPLVGSGYVVTLLLLTFMYTALAASWNLISGYTGYVSFGHAAFFGVGAYTAGILLAKRLAPWPLAAVGAGLAAALLALVLGYPALRLRGPYFAVATLGLAEVVRVAVTVAEPLTGGGKGLTLPPTLNLVPAYYAMALLAALTVGTTALVASSPVGLRLLAIREDETAAEVCGVRTTRLKLAAFYRQRPLRRRRRGALRLEHRLHRPRHRLRQRDHRARHRHDHVRRAGHGLGPGAGGRRPHRHRGGPLGPLPLPAHGPLRGPDRGHPDRLPRGADRHPPGAGLAPPLPPRLTAPETRWRRWPQVPQGAAGAILTLDEVTKRFGGLTAVDGVSFAIARGAITGLIGPNGSGKTTLFGLISGVERPNSGGSVFNGQPIAGRPPHAVTRLGMGRTFQITRLFGQMTALENLLVGARGLSPAQATARGHDLLAFVGLEALAGEYAANLSYGQQKLLEFVRVLVPDPDLILLDEPFAGVNPAMEERLIARMRDLQAQGQELPRHRPRDAPDHGPLRAPPRPRPRRPDRGRRAGGRAPRPPRGGGLLRPLSERQ